MNGMKEMQRIRVGMRGIWLGIQKMSGIRWRCRESRWEVAVEITWNSNGNGKLKDWREVIIENLVSRI